MEAREIKMYEKKSFIRQLMIDAIKVTLGVAIIFSLSQHNWSIDDTIDDIYNSVANTVTSAVSDTTSSAQSSINLTRDLLAREIMSEESREALNQLVANSNEVVTIKEQLSEIKNENEELKLALDSALIPESSIKEVAVNHIVEPTKEGFYFVRTKVSTLWNTYEFQPKKVTGWIHNVF